LTQIPFQLPRARQYIDIVWNGYDLTRKSFRRVSKVTNSMPGGKQKGRRTPRRPSPISNEAGSEKRLNARLCTAENQRVNVVRAFVRIHHFEIDEVTGDAEFIGDAVTAEHVAREPTLP
jgi:hypothetical protein